MGPGFRREDKGRITTSIPIFTHAFAGTTTTSGNSSIILASFFGRPPALAEVGQGG